MENNLRLTLREATKVLQRLLAESPSDVLLVPFGPNLRSVARANDKHPDEGRIVLAAPDEVVRNITGAKDQQDVFLIVRMRRAAVERLTSPILRPGDILR